MLTIILRTLGLPSPQVLAVYAAAFVLACIVSFGAGWKVNGWRWEAAVADQKAEAAATLQSKTEAVRALERKGEAMTNELERAYVERSDERTRQQEESARLAARLHDALGRMQRPGRGQGGGGAVPGPSDAAACTERLQAASTKLSAAVERLAQGGNAITRDADRDADIAGLGADFAVKVVGQMSAGAEP